MVLFKVKLVQKKRADHFTCRLISQWAGGLEGAGAHIKVTGMLVEKFEKNP